MPVRSEQPRYRLWMLDDEELNIRKVERSLPRAVLAVLEFQAFRSAIAFQCAFEDLLESDPSRLPDFLLLDFFLDGVVGTDVLEFLKASSEGSRLVATVIIAHSSSDEANAALVARGADFALAKRGGVGISRSIQETFASPEALRWVREHRSPPEVAARR